MQAVGRDGDGPALAGLAQRAAIHGLAGGARAVLLGAAGGILYGAGAALTKSVMSYLDDGLVDVVTSWEVYALIIALSLGTYLQQSAFQAGSLAQSLPAISVLEPVTAVILGMTVLQEEIRADGLEWALIAVAAVAMIVRGHSAFTPMPSSFNSCAMPSTHMLMPNLAME